MVTITIIMIMVIREEDSYSSNPPSFPSPSSDESRKRLNVHFPEVRFSPKVKLGDHSRSYLIR